MKFDLASDLHITSATSFSFGEYAPSDTLVLAGDISEILRMPELVIFLDKMSKVYKKILYVLGNHEYYGSVFSSFTIFSLRQAISHLPVEVLDNSLIEIDGVVFMGSTLWSDMDRGNPITELQCKRYISDYKYILNEHNSISITPEDTQKAFKESVSFLEDSLFSQGDEKPVVMITHHAPSYQSVAEQYKGLLTTGAFVSNLEYLMYDNPQIKVWCHGHTHTSFDYRVNKTRVVCHPKGYHGEIKGSSLYAPLTIEVLTI